MYGYLYLFNYLNTRSGILRHASTQCVIPKMHSYGHGYKCLRLYNPLRNRGCGDIDGESCERLWSKLGYYII